MKFLDDAVKKTLKKPILEVVRRGKAPSDEVPEDTTVGGDKGFRANFWGWIKYFWREYADGITETQTYNSHRFAHQFGFDKGILGHFSTLALPVVVASLAFKKENIIKILVSSPKIPFTSPTRNGLPSPRFKSWWSDLKERVRNFGENDAQLMDVPLIFQGDLTLKPLLKAKSSSTKRKKNAKTPSIKKPKVHSFLYSDCFL